MKLEKGRFIKEFKDIIGLEPILDSFYQKDFDALIRYISGKNLKPLSRRKREFVALLNKKFNLNGKVTADIYSKAASYGYTFNFHQKRAIQRALNFQDESVFEEVLTRKGFDQKKHQELCRLFKPISFDETVNCIRKECSSPSKLRKEKGDRDIANEILKGLFSAFLWVSLEEKEMHAYYNSECSKNYRDSYWEQLQFIAPNLFNRNNALHVLQATQNDLDKFKKLDLFRDALTKKLSEVFDNLNNYGFVAFLIDPMRFNKRSVEWELVEDLILFGEKFVETPLDKGYFSREKVEQETISYIKNLDVKKTKFELVNEGLTYRDCFLITHNSNINKIVLIFQKNERDETIIPCPTCRSKEVRGNSYSSFGVRSWECQNLLCPDRSKYNRGKRYSFKALLMQEAIENDCNLIPSDSVRKWQRDIVSDIEDSEILTMLIRHYSMCGDAIHLHNLQSQQIGCSHRKLVRHELNLEYGQLRFFDSALFHRFLATNPRPRLRGRNLGNESFQVFAGDSAQVLSTFSDNSFDGAVTSPPYYNAREYSQWPNMYCYLSDMLAVNGEVFRTLKPGALYLYNIFDYFDNERTIAFSAMGQKRMILSAYTADLFRRIGFELLGNIAWDKGEIEGKRGFNSGNFSPFYQSPFNCWEHILIFRKPGRPLEDQSGLTNILGTVFRCQPVIKMVKGKNIHGHTAPFPDGLPQILAKILPEGSTILDPFAGSLTTGRVAERYGLRSVNIELSEKYCELGLNLRQKEINLLKLKPDQSRIGPLY